MELPARWFKAASRTEKGVFSVPRWSLGGSGTERGVFSVRDDSGDADYDKKLPETAGPQAEKKRCRQKLLGHDHDDGDIFLSGEFQGPLGPRLVDSH